MDHYGIGSGVFGAVQVYFQGARRTGRTTSLVESLKNGDQVVFQSEIEGRRVQKLCKERGVSIEVIVCDTNSPERLFSRCRPLGDARTVLDHSWVEQFYINAITRTQDEIFQLEKNLSGHGAPHRETKREAAERLKWRT